jgi:HAD superfamily hydrolase (TIGR01549 family)
MPVFFSEDEVKRFGKEMEKARGELFKKDFIQKVRPFPQVRALFERLKDDGYQLALASSAKKEELEHYAKLLKIDDLIDAGTSSDDAEKSKPHPDIFQAALKQLGGLKGEAAFAVGDTPYDAQSAGKADIKTLGMLCGGFPKADLRDAGVIEIYDDPSDLLERYDQSAFSKARR